MFALFASICGVHLRKPPQLSWNHVLYHLYFLTLHISQLAIAPDLCLFESRFSFSTVNQEVMSTSALSAATQDRKARLAQLKSLKRKQPDTYQEPDEDNVAPRSPKSPRIDDQPTKSTDAYLSGRNYDPVTRGPKLGFETAPSANQTTLEKKAEELAAEARKQAAEEEKEEKPLDLFKLQPKKPNWDLKRDLQAKLDVLNVRTENAIARLVRERIQGAQVAKRKEPIAVGNGAEEGDQEGRTMGLEGAGLVEATHVLEREAEDDERREREAEEELLAGS